MSSKRLNLTADSGLTVYGVVFRLSDGYAFDWSDNTFKVLASCTTPTFSMSSLGTFGTDRATYAATVNLSTINATLAPVDVDVIFFKRLGGSNAPATDTAIGEVSAFTIVAGDIPGSGGSGGGYLVDAGFNLTTNDSTAAHFTASLKYADGSPVDLATLDPSATCAVEITMDADTTGGERFPVDDIGTSGSLSTSDCGSVNSDSKFEVEIANPNLTSNRGFLGRCTITTGGVAYVGDVVFYT